MSPVPVASSSFADDVRHHLQLVPRQIPSRYLYDALGSALFDAICELPWYGITRAEHRLLERYRVDILRQIPGLTTVIELGPGDGRKLQMLLRAASTRLAVHLIDVSASALARATQTLSRDRTTALISHEASFEDGLDSLWTVPPNTPTLLLFLGSNIGNFDPPVAGALLRRIRAALPEDGALLLGVDLVKPEGTLLAAYDDPLGVSAAFNLNVLVRINRELGGNFDVRAFRHRAIWNRFCGRMEMFAVSTKRQRVTIDAIDLEVEFDEGEAIWTESSYKYTLDQCARLLIETGFESVGQWMDRDDGFVLLFARKRQD